MHAGEAGLVHLFGGGSMTKPYDIIRWATITPELGEAEHRREEASTKAPELELGEASFELLQVVRWQLDLVGIEPGNGEERSEAVIKITQPSP